MIRQWMLLTLSVLLVVGCGDGSSDDGATPTDGAAVDGNADGTSADGSASDGVIDDGASDDSAAADGIVTPTVDDSQQQAKVRDMEMGELIAALSDAELADSASKELVSRGGDAVKPLIDTLGSEDAIAVQKAIFTLSQLGTTAKDALPKLTEIAEDSDSEVLQDSAKFAIDAIEGN